MRKLLLIAALLYTGQYLSAQTGTSPGNPFVDAGDDITVDCVTDCVDLTADYLDIGLTDSYTISSIPFDPPFPFQGLSNSVNTNIDDAWSDVGNLPFDFCYFSQIETEFQVGSNGVVRFDVDPGDTGAASNGWQFTEDLPNNINETLAEANIFTPGHDIDPEVFTTDEIAWEIIGTAPNRVLAVSFFEVPMWSAVCNDRLATHMVVFYETTNVIDIYVRDKPACPEHNDGSAVLGIQNHDGTVAYVPPGRNTSDSPWSTTNEAWRFTPTGSSVVDFAWLDASGNVISTNPTINVCVTQNSETYTARALYTNCNGDIIDVRDDVVITTLAPYTVDLGADLNLCVGDSDTVFDVDIFSPTATYQWQLNGVDISGETNPTLTVTSPNSGTYGVWVSDQGCSEYDELVVTYFTPPVLSVVSDMEQCEDDVIDGISVFVFNDKDAEIINGQTGVNVSYHISLSDAVNNVNPLSKAGYSNTSNPETIHYRLQNDANPACFVTGTFQLLVSPAITPTAPDDMVVCDDSSNDGVEIFDLTIQDAVIRTTLSSNDYTLTYHEVLADAENGLNPIPAPSTHFNAANPQTIFVRVEYDLNPVCYEIVTFDLIVNPFPVVSGPTPYELCDDAVADGFTEFVLSSKATEINPSGSDYSITYHELLSDSQTGLNPLPDNYTNTIAFFQTIFARIEDNQTGCWEIIPLDLIVNVNPLPNDTPPNLTLCDDNNPGDLIEVFDLTQNEIIIQNGESTVLSYFTSSDDAENDQNPVADPTAFTNQSQLQTIFVRVEDPTTGCFVVVSFDIEVLPVPLPNPQQSLDIIQCEVNFDGIDTFDLEQNTALILTGLDPMDYTVTYHESQADAVGNVGALVSPYTNIANPQDIFVRVTDNINGCFNTTLQFVVEVQQDAIANGDGIPIEYNVCDDNVELDGDPSNDRSLFDLSTLDGDLLDGQDPGIYGVSYFATLQDATDNVNPLPLLYENDVNPQIIYGRVGNISTTDGVCFDVAEIRLEVFPLPVFDLDDSVILCLGTNGTETIGPPVLDPGLSPANYSFEWYDANGMLISNGALLYPSEPGTYTLIVTDDATGCSSQDVVNVIGSGPPILTAEVITVPFASQQVIEATATGPGTYEFSLDDGPWQSDGRFEGVSPGEHIVYARDVNGCGSASAVVLIIDYPRYFTPNGDGYNDTWNIEGLADQNNARILIYDRFGKLLKQISPAGLGWDGTFNGNNMPATDYWFTVEYNEPRTNTPRVFRSHFALRR